MAKCVRCGMEGAFVRLDERGLCALCRVKSPVSAKPEKKTLRPGDLDPAAVLERYFCTDHAVYPSGYDVVAYYTAEFDCMLSSLPAAPVTRTPFDGERGEPECVYRRKLEGCDLAACGDFVALDTETGGLDASAQIVEVSAVKFRAFRPVQTFSTLCRPYGHISPAAVQIHGITDADVADAPRFAEIARCLDAFIEGLPLAAHNAPFDLRMLASEGFPTHGRLVYDTLPIARKILRDRRGEKLESYRLASACRACAVLFSGAHRAEADAFAAGLLFCELVKRQFGVADLWRLSP